MSDFDDEINKRQEQLNALEPPQHEEAHDEFFGEDDLDQAARVQSQIQPAAGSGLAQKTTLRDEKWTGLNNVARFARINPPSVLHGTLGGQQMVSVTNTSANLLADGLTYRGTPFQVVNWGGEDSETIPVTITLAPVGVAPQLQAGQRIATGVGIVQFGTRGALVKAEIDVKLGCQFTVSGSSVTVQVAAEVPFSPGGGAVRTYVQNIAGMASYYQVPNKGATRTRVVNFATGSTTPIVVSIPPFARAVTFQHNGSTAWTYDLVFTGPSVGNNVLIGLPATSVLIANGFTSITIEPTVADANLPDGVLVIFELDF